MRYAIVYGVLAGAIAVGVIVAEQAFHLPRQHQYEWFGYQVMLVAQ
jgi:hypothetical protein